jgi:hypothetical protein
MLTAVWLRSIRLFVPAPLLFAAAFLGGCVTTTDPDAENRQGFNWRLRATELDRGRLRAWRDAWVEGLREAREAGHGAQIEQEGVLLDPDAALTEPSLPAGGYSCRTLKLGRRGPTGLAFVAYEPFRCEVIAAGGVVRLVKLTGSQRPHGILYNDTPRRMVFIGTLVLGDGERPLDYSFDRERDMIGALERIGERRWRLVLPRPSFESDLDVIELIPSG